MADQIGIGMQIRLELGRLLAKIVIGVIAVPNEVRA